LLALVAVSLIGTTGVGAWSQNETSICDWAKLGLTEAQRKQIQAIETEWEQQYSQLMPSLTDDQRRLAKLLEEHNSNPVEVMAAESSIARKREELDALALANFLKKKELLDDNQKHNLELMIKHAIAERHRSDATSAVNEEMPDHLQGLMQRVRKIWPVEGER
jgi:Spy/CpxP family protein refolding chaperone